jgi:uncharacterized RDD family membrane protein YckC
MEPMTMPPDDREPTPDETVVTPTPVPEDPQVTPTPGPGPILGATPTLSTPPPPASTSGWVTAPVRAEVVPGLEYASTLSRLVAFIVDTFLIGILASVVAAVVPGGQTPTSFGGGVVYSPVFNLVSALVGAAYFVGFWSGGRRATLGQMLFKIQVGNAGDGRSLTTEQALKRWFGLGLFLPIIGVVPGLTSLAGLIEFVWTIVLLITTASSPTKQGLHDRYAETAVVRPVGASNALVWGCLVLLVFIPILLVLAFLSVFMVGSQVSTVLSQVGNSV